MTVTEYPVSGMTCEHCVGAVTRSVSQLPGVTDVTVDLQSGLVRVTSAGPLDDEAVASAVDNAGYELG